MSSNNKAIAMRIGIAVTCDKCNHQAEAVKYRPRLSVVCADHIE